MNRGDARQIIKSMQRQWWLALLTRLILLATLAFGFLGLLLQNTMDPSHQPGESGWGNPAIAFWSAMTFSAMAWALLSILSIRQVRAANQASAYIVSGRLDLAEEQLKSVMRQFSFYPKGKLLACQNLAVVAHGQKYYRAAAELCDGVISLQDGITHRIGRTCRILLADCHLLLGEIAAAWRAIEPLSTMSDQLNLTEQLLILPIELRCQVAQGDYDRVIDSLPWKVHRAELLDSPRASLTHALLATACRETGKRQAAIFLQRRAELYHDLSELKESYPDLQGSIFDKGTGSDTSLPPSSADNS